MLVYQATKREFMDDVGNDAITTRITEAFEQRVHRANASEVRAYSAPSRSPIPPEADH